MKLNKNYLFTTKDKEVQFVTKIVKVTEINYEKIYTHQPMFFIKGFGDTDETRNITLELLEAVYLTPKNVDWNTIDDCPEMKL